MRGRSIAHGRSIVGSVDFRSIKDKPLRKTEKLPLQGVSDDGEELSFHEAQTSSLSWGPDEWFWTELFLVDTYFGSEPELTTYLDPPTPADSPGDGNDPPLGGGGSMKYTPYFDPREYFLRKLDRRFDQVAKEHSALIETFNQRMESYVSLLI
jgi:hypothetical protein